MKLISPLFVFILFFSSCSQEVDLLIQNGRLIDGSGSKGEIKEVAILGDRIVQVGSSLNVKAKRVIDANGLVVSPGFIDVHAHIEPLPLMPHAESHVRQGVTTALGGPDGGGPLPIGAYLDSLIAKGVGMNIAYLVGHNTVRNHVMGLVNREPTAEELQEMVDIIDRSMQEGAYGNFNRAKIFARYLC